MSSSIYDAKFNKSETHYKGDRLELVNMFLNDLAFWGANELLSGSGLSSNLFWNRLMLMSMFYWLCFL